MKNTLRIVCLVVIVFASFCACKVEGDDGEIKDGGHLNSDNSVIVEPKKHQHKHHHHNGTHHHHHHHHKHHKHHHRARLNGGKVALSDYDEYARQRKARQRIDQPDNWEKIPFLFQTYNEPDNYYQMPVLSNGYVGTTVKNDSIYVNGLYSGVGERSHRVRIPSMTAIEASMVTSDRITYHFDCRRGVYTIETRNNKAVVTQRFYAHRSKRNLIVTEVKVELLVNDVIQIQLHNMTQLELNHQYIDAPENPNKYSYYRQRYNPENISFEQRVIKEPSYAGKIEQNDGTYYFTQRIMLTELSNKRQKEIHTYYTNVPNQLVVNTTNKVFHFVQSVDSDMNRARSAYEDAMNSVKNDPNSLYVSHTAAWEEIWTKHGFAMLTDNNFGDANSESFKLAQRLYSSFYNIYAAIPHSSTESGTQFYGLSPAGLAYGGLKSEFFNSTQTNLNRHLSEGYGGHVMYNQELWILPLVSMFSYDMSKLLIQSRVRRGLNQQELNVYEQARELAKVENLEGLRYPWEQGDFGVDVSPYQDARKTKIHTSGDISFGVKSYLRMSQNRDFLLQAVSNEVTVRGEEFLNEIAKYWSGRMKLESASNKYEIKTVSFGERPQSREVDNEGFTNCLAAEALKTYKYSLELNDRNPYDSTYSFVTKDYDDKINKIKMPYDSSRQLYLEYDGFTPSNQNEETFIPFLNYPIQVPMNYQQKKSIFENYANQLSNEGKNTPAFASFIVGHLELNEEQKAKDYMARFGTHFIEPFQVLSEYPQRTTVVNPSNTFHYLPGYAAFIHTFIAGYSGIRPRDFQLDIVYPTDQYTGYSTPSVGTFNVFKQPAANLDSWNITGLTYRGSKLDIIYNLRSKSVEIKNRRSTDTTTTADDSLEVIVYEGTNAEVKPLKVGDSVMISLTTDQWTYAAKKSRLQKSNGYTENMHILASIYSKNYARQLKKPSSASFLKVAPAFLLFLCAVYHQIVRYLS